MIQEKRKEEEKKLEKNYKFHLLANIVILGNLKPLLGFLLKIYQKTKKKYKKLRKKYLMIPGGKQLPNWVSTGCNFPE